MASQRNIGESIVHHVGVLAIAAACACLAAFVTQVIVLNGPLGVAVVASPLSFLIVLYYLMYLVPAALLFSPLWVTALRFGLIGQLAAVGLTALPVFAVRPWLGPPGYAFTFDDAAISAAMMSTTAAMYYALEPRFP